MNVPQAKLFYNLNQISAYNKDIKIDMTFLKRTTLLGKEFINLDLLVSTIDSAPYIARVLYTEFCRLVFSL